MFMKFFAGAKGPTTLEEYKAIVKSRVRLCWCLVGLGVLTLCATLLLMNGSIAQNGDTAYLQGLWCGIGSGIIAAGILLAMRQKALLKNEAKLHQKQLAEQDERNQAIISQALVLTACICFALLYVAMLLSSFLNIVVFRTLGACIVGFALVFLACKAICQKKM